MLRETEEHQPDHLVNSKVQVSIPMAQIPGTQFSAFHNWLQQGLEDADSLTWNIIFMCEIVLHMF